MPGARTSWRPAALVLLCGVFAASQTGKLPPAIPELRQAFGASLVEMGWIASVINLVAACTGLVAGLVADRIGRHALLKFGLAVLGLGAGLGLTADSTALLFASRVLEGLGFVAVVIAAPVLVRASVAPHQQRLALGIWSAYTSVGMTLMMLAAPWSLPAFGWKGGWWLGVLGAAVLLALVVRHFPGRGTGPASGVGAAGLLRGLRSATPWLLAASFGLYTMCWMSLMVWMPTFLLEQGGLGLMTVGALVALMIAINAPGNIVGGWLAQRRVPLLPLIVVPISVIASCGWTLFALAPQPHVVVALGATFSFFGGILPGAIYAWVPAVAATHDNLASVNGLVVQASNLGMLAGPPLAAALVSAGGWNSLSLLYPAAGLVCVACGWAGCRAPALRRAAAGA
ncbi:MFS transporter [Hydrogenophaga borbori]|jgi:MFS family permease